MFFVTNMTTGERPIDTPFESYDAAVESFGSPAECNDWCSRNGCDIIWYDDDDDEPITCVELTICDGTCVDTPEGQCEACAYFEAQQWLAEQAEKPPFKRDAYLLPTITAETREGIFVPTLNDDLIAMRDKAEGVT